MPKPGPVHCPRVARIQPGGGLQQTPVVAAKRASLSLFALACRRYDLVSMGASVCFGFVFTILFLRRVTVIRASAVVRFGGKMASLAFFVAVLRDLTATATVTVISTDLPRNWDRFATAFPTQHKGFPNGQRKNLPKQ